MGVFCVFYTCMKLHSKQIETLELAPKFVELLFVNSKTYDDTIAYRMLACASGLSSCLFINSSLKKKIDWNGIVKTKS